MIHADPDDFHTQPAGDSGMKIACGVIRPARRRQSPPSGGLRHDLTCRNPRCISAAKQELPQIFRLTGKAAGIHRCVYCVHIAE